MLGLSRMTSEQFSLLNDNIPTTPTSFRHSGAAAPMTLKEQEKLIDEMKKENFDLKLKVYHLEDRLRQMAPGNVEAALKENVELKVQNEALLAEIRGHQEIISEAQLAIEQYRQQNAGRPGAEAELARMKQELELTLQQLQKSQGLCQRYEGQLALFDKESRETVQRMKAGELEMSAVQKRLADSQHTIERLEEELRGLEEELAAKNTLIHQFRADSQGMAGELEMITRQMGELQEALRACQAERDNLIKERDSIKRTTLSEIAKQTGMSPHRSSLDLLESKLMRELGQASKRLQELEKQTETSAGEKVQLLSTQQGLAQSLEQATHAIKHLGSKLSTVSPDIILMEGGFPEVFGLVERATDGLIRECLEQRQVKASMGDALAKQEQINATLQGERQRLEHELHKAEGRLADLHHTLAQKEEEARRAQAMAEEWQGKVNTAYDSELPRLQEELLGHKARLGQLEADLCLAKEDLQRAQSAAGEFKAKWEEAQSIAIQASSESSDRLSHISQLQASRADLAKKLAGSEELIQNLNRKLEEIRGQLEHADKVKVAVEEGFNRQLKQLHAQNTELKLQLATNSSGTSEANARLERVGSAMESLRQEKDALFSRLQAKEHAIGSLQQELDTLRMDRKRTETDLALREEQLRKAEFDLSRLRKDDHRKNTDGLQHLQAKIDSLTALNTYLREQADQKDRHIRELEDRLRSQSEEMRSTIAEVENQSRKLKKREQLISQALKRLETINSLQLAPEGVAAQPMTSSLGLNQYTGPAEELTPIRPAKLPFTNGAHNTSSAQMRPAGNKENNSRMYGNYEF